MFEQIPESFVTLGEKIDALTHVVSQPRGSRISRWFRDIFRK